MPIVAEEYQFVIGVDTHAASHSFAVIAPATTAVGQEAQGEFQRTSQRRERWRTSWDPGSTRRGREDRLR